jgi:hypothetical protein
MIQTFTPNDVLKAESGELTPEESIQLEATVKESPELAEFSETLNLLAEQMPGLITDPGEKLVNRIMDRIRLEAVKTPA